MEDRYRSSVRRAELPRTAYNHDAMPVETTSFRPNTSSELYDTSMLGFGPRYGSHRRRNSHAYAEVSQAGHLPEAPEAPEVPWDPNPYQMKSQRYSDTKRRVSTNQRSQSYEPYDAQFPQPQTSLPSQKPLGTVSPISPPTPEEIDIAVRRRESKRTPKGGVPEQSPLQKLEGKLGDISKEEKRARMLEAEAKFQKRASNYNERSTLAASQAPIESNTAVVSKNAHRQRQISSKQNTQAHDGGFLESGTKPNPRQQRGDSHSRIDAAVDRAMNSAARASHDYKDRQQQTRAGDYASADHDNVATRAVGLGLYNGPNYNQNEKLEKEDDLQMDMHSRNVHHQPSDELRPREAAQETNQSFNMDEGKDSINRKFLRMNGGRDSEFRQTIKFSEDNRNTGSTTTVGTRRKSMGAYQGMNRGSELYFKPQRALEEWRSAGRATLIAEDFNLVQPDAAGNRNVAWWERKDFQRWKSNSKYSSAPNEDSKDNTRRQTAFNPPLYLRCGPLLRYTGIQKAKPYQEMWTGSVMIVTDDQKSSYVDPPVLRLFSQPMTPLTAPPDDIRNNTGQDLSSDYVDPVEGETKSSRSGKTLYVRPVDHLEDYVDLSRIENDDGLFEEVPSTSKALKAKKLRLSVMDGEKANKYRQVRGCRLLCERGVTFWRFSISVELVSQQKRVAYRINNGPAIGFWVPAKGSSMNVMFHSCNGFSVSVNPNDFSGPDPLWRDVLNSHQFKPFHVMIGGGDQIYMDAVVQKTTHFRKWMSIKDNIQKQSFPFSKEMQQELEDFYLRRYCTWFSSGLFGLANSQIPMINIWDDHDILDGYGSYSHYSMSSPVFLGIGAIAFKYYMLFQHQSLSQETQKEEPSWQLGAAPGPYIQEKSRSIFAFLGKQIAFLGLDCRTERMRDEILTPKSYDLVFERLRNEIVSGVTKHLIVMLGVPIAYPRLNFLENIFTSRAFEPIKALGKAGMMGNFLNKLDGGVEVLDDLDDHWTAKHHKQERNWLIEELQELALEKSVRITILGGDVHLAAVGQFYSNKKLGLPKDRDHRYMPNVISSAITNTPPPDMMADIINQRNKIHHLDAETEEDMIPMFLEDVDGAPRKNTHLLPRRNWCAIREYLPGSTPLPSPSTAPSTPEQPEVRPGLLSRTNSLSRRDFKPANLARRLSRGAGPPVSFRGARSNETNGLERRHSTSDADAINTRDSYFPQQPLPKDNDGLTSPPSLQRPVSFLRRPTNISEKALRQDYGGKSKGAELGDDSRDGHINLEGGLEVVINAEMVKGDPAGITTPYKLLIPTLLPFEPYESNGTSVRRKGRMDDLLQGFKGVRGIRRTSTAPITQRQNDSWNQEKRGSEESAPIDEETIPDVSSPAQVEKEEKQNSLSHRQIFLGESFRAESNQRVSSYRINRSVSQNENFSKDGKVSYQTESRRQGLPSKEQGRELDTHGHDRYFEGEDDELYRADSSYRDDDRGASRNVDHSDRIGDGAARKSSYRRNSHTGRTDSFRQHNDKFMSRVATEPTSTSVSAPPWAPESRQRRLGARITSVGAEDYLDRDELDSSDDDADDANGHRRDRGHEIGGEIDDDDEEEEEEEEDDDDLDLDINDGYNKDGRTNPTEGKKMGSKYMMAALEDYSNAERRERPAYGDRVRRWSWKMWK